MTWQVCVALVAAYVLGSVPSGYWLVRVWKGIDIRTIGSGNIGATNAMRAGGKAAGIIALALDVVKGLGAALALGRFGASAPGAIPPDVVPLATGLAAIVGHNWTIFLRFKGGKGVATSLGVFVGVLPVPLAVSAAVFVIMVYLFRYVSLGSVSAALAFPTLSAITGAPKTHIAFAAIASAMLIWRHRANMSRLLRGAEHKLGQPRRES